jgi:hypothetical protein
LRRFFVFDVVIKIHLSDNSSYQEGFAFLYVYLTPESPEIEHFSSKIEGGVAHSERLTLWRTPIVLDT